MYRSVRPISALPGWQDTLSASAGFGGIVNDGEVLTKWKGERWQTGDSPLRRWVEWLCSSLALCMLATFGQDFSGFSHIRGMRSHCEAG